MEVYSVQVGIDRRKCNLWGNDFDGFKRINTHVN